MSEVAMRDADVLHAYDMLGQVIEEYRKSSNGSYFPCKKAYMVTGFWLGFYMEALRHAHAYPSREDDVPGIPVGSTGDSIFPRVQKVIKASKWVERELTYIELCLRDDQSLKRAEAKLWSLQREIQRKARRA